VRAIATDIYPLEDAETHVATLRGQVDRLSEVITKNDSTDPPNSPAAGLIHFSASGQHKYASSDGGYYNTGWARARTTTDQTVSFTTDQVITGTVALSLPVAAIEYRVRGKITWTQGAGTVKQALGLTTTGTTSHVRIPNLYVQVGAGVSVDAGNPNPAIFTTLAGGVSTPSIANTAVVWWEFDGVVVFTSAGTFSAVAHCNATNTFTVNSYSFIEISPDT